MSRATFFMRECPTCGRRLQIRVEYLGRAVRCKHCDAQFVACDPTIAHTDSGDSLLDRANHLLESYDSRRYHPR
ncbi:MAG: response regulator [Pirellulaceae bacterium]|jgi:hypothetical protein|nr:response regulator [Pirellulaceae bacterium]